jgi:hypothetical protein
MRFSWSVSRFSFQFCLVLFAAINGWTPTNFFWRSYLAFHLTRILRFSLLSFNECSFFSATVFSFHFFALICVQIFLYLCIKVYFYLWSMLVFIKRVISKRFKWCWKREKVSCKKVIQKGACVDCGLGFCMSCLMSFW